MDWLQRRGLNATFSTWTGTCCGILERHAEVDGDRILASLARLSNTSSEAGEAFHNWKGQSEQQRHLILTGLELQYKEQQQRMPAHVAQSRK